MKQYFLWFKMLKKKATLLLTPVVRTTLLIMAFLIIAFFILQLRDAAKSSGMDTICAASIQQHIIFTETYLIGKEKLTERAGVLSLFIDPNLDIPVIKCDTKLVKSKAKTSEEAEKEILTQAVRTWGLFNKGESLIYKDIKDKNTCFVSHVFDFSNDLDLSLQYKASITKVNELIKYKKDDETVLEYLSVMPLDHLIDYTIIPDAENPDEVADSLLQTIEKAESEDLTEEEFYESEYNMNLQINYYQMIDSLSTSTISDKTAIKKINKYCVNYAGFLPFPKNTKDNIAIVFLQCHETDKGLWIFDQEIIKDEDYFKSSLYIVPYNEEVLNLIGCEELPIEFED